MRKEAAGGTTRHIRGYSLVASECESARTYYHYASDSLGSITHVVEGSEVLGRYGYDAWGNLTECDEKVRNRFRYCGEMQDPVSQQYYLRARYYNPVIGRFIQEDTYRGDGLNLYAYCANSPVNYVDPSGHWCETKQNIYNKLEAEARSRGEVIDGARKLELMAEVANAAKGKNAGADPVIYLEGGSGSWNKDSFRKNADPFRDVMGPGMDSHPEQWNALLNEMKDNGVEIVYREGAMAYSPAKGLAGQLVVDPNASYSALIHEYTHYLDDADAGFPGMQYHFQTIKRVKMELHAYMQEIKLADSLGYKDVANQLFENYRAERALLAGHLK